MMSLPSEGSDIVRSAEHSSRMTPRFGLIMGAALTALVALVLAFVPADWLAGLLGVSGVDATSFLVRRYGASATAALCVSTAAIAVQAAPSRAALLALSAWFGVQGLVAVWGLAFGHVGGLAWAAVVADPLIAGWFIALSAKVDTG
jgi:hypothetical protein